MSKRDDRGCSLWTLTHKKMRDEYNAAAARNARFPRFEDVLFETLSPSGELRGAVLTTCVQTRQRDVEHLRTSIVVEVTRHLTVLEIDAMKRHRRHVAWKMRAGVTNLYRKARITRKSASSDVSIAVDNRFISRLGFINYSENNVPPQETILIVVLYFEMLSSEGCTLVSFRYIKIIHRARTATRRLIS